MSHCQSSCPQALIARRLLHTRAPPVARDARRDGEPFTFLVTLLGRQFASSLTGDDASQANSASDGLGATRIEIAGKNSRLAKLLIPFLRMPEAFRFSGDNVKLWRKELAARPADLATATISRAQTIRDLREAQINDATRISGNHRTPFLAYCWCRQFCQRHGPPQWNLFSSSLPRGRSAACLDVCDIPGIIFFPNAAPLRERRAAKVEENPFFLSQ